jgi:hypothetical protein
LLSWRMDANARRSESSASYADILLWDWDLDFLEGKFWQNLDISDFIEGPSLFLLLTSSEEDVGGRRLISSWQWTHKTSD